MSKPFKEYDHYTPVHDGVFDEILPLCPPNAFKVLMLVIRKTRGWQKDEDAISYSQIKTGCGIKSNGTVTTALKWLVEHAMLVRHEGARWEALSYSLNKDYVLPEEEEEDSSTPKIGAGSTPIFGAGSTPKIGDTINTEIDKRNNFSKDKSLEKLDELTPEVEKGKIKERAVSLMLESAQRIEEITGIPLTQKRRAGHVRSWRAMIENGVPDKELEIALEKLVEKWTTTTHRPSPATARAWALEGEPARVRDGPPVPLEDGPVIRRDLDAEAREAELEASKHE